MRTKNIALTCLGGVTLILALAITATAQTNTFPSSGNVGVGTTTPATNLEVKSSSHSTININSGSGSTDASVLFQRAGVNQWFFQSRNSGSPTDSFVLYDAVNTSFRFVVNRSGNVGIGITTPTERLHVSGNGKFTGNLTVDGNIAAKYQDVAEWVSSSEKLTAGTVVILDSSKSNQVVASTAAYDTRVAGVISAQPGITLGEKSDDKVLVATTGRVKVKVDASRAQIHIGDLLVTSEVPGVAMKSTAVNLGGVQIHRPGTLIGKALEPLEKGSGEILVLLSLQ